MRWLTHQTGAVAAALILNLPPVAVCAAFAGSVLPDMLDQGISRLGVTKRRKQQIFNRIHRGTSHWFGWWLGFLILTFAPSWHPAIALACGGLAFGALSHVFLDMLTTCGVPLLPFTRKGKLSLGLCATGKWGEYVFLGALVCASACYLCHVKFGGFENCRSFLRDIFQVL